MSKKRPREDSDLNQSYNVSQKSEDPFPGEAPISQKRIKKYERGKRLDVTNIKTGFHRHDQKKKDYQIAETAKQAARTEFLLRESPGCLIAEEGEHTSQYSQYDIAQNVDVSNAQKYFNLTLDLGPYMFNYTKNGRFMVSAGQKGHLWAMDVNSKNLLHETSVKETCHDVKFLHQETMYAVAQKQWTYIYDNQGIELHCLKLLDRVLRLEFLRYHFLLVSGNVKSYMCYIDVSTGKKVAGFSTGLGPLNVMTQNPTNAIVIFGHSGGTVTMWSPNVKEPVVKMLCHGAGTTAVAVDPTGTYLATSGLDRYVKIFDLRHRYKPLAKHPMQAGASSLCFSQTGLLAAGVGDIVEIYRDVLSLASSPLPYMRHRAAGTVGNVQFCPNEDVLGVGHAKGFSSLLVPGSGEPNIDAFESNPFQTKKQRQESEVKMLLEKIPAELISIKEGALGLINTKTMKEKMEEKAKLMFLPPQKTDPTLVLEKNKSKAANPQKTLDTKAKDK